MSSEIVQPETPRIHTEAQVMFFDTDCAGVVHNLAYLRYIEVARTLMAEELGMGLAAMADSQIFPVLVRTEIDYKKSARLGDRLLIDGTLESVERTRFWVSFEVRRSSDNAITCHCRQLLAVLQMPGSKLIRLPADWSTRFAHLHPRARVSSGA